MPSATKSTEEELWSVFSGDETSETEDAKPQQKNLHMKVWIIGILIVVGVCASIAIPIGITAYKDSCGQCGCAAKQPMPPCGFGICGCSDACTYASNGTCGCGCACETDYRGTYFDTLTWKDKKDFNVTFTAETVGGLPIMGLFDNYDDSRFEQEWSYGIDPIRGVNLGGWLTLEPFITPSFFSAKDEVIDEFTFCDNMLKTQGKESLKERLEEHYASFITENDFKMMKEAGMDHVRIPFGYWAVFSLEQDPYLANISWRYLLRGIEWARKHGIRVILDLHAVPGSQNGWNHSGRQGEVRWMNETDSNGEVFATETLAIHHSLARFFSQPRYRKVIAIYGLVNEPLTFKLGPERVIEWHQKAYQAVREEGYENYIVYGDGLMGPDYYNDKMPVSNYTKLILDIHQYVVFDQYLLSLPHGEKLGLVCGDWRHTLRKTRNPVIVGEWSVADTDCATYLNNVGDGSRWEGKFNGTETSLPVLEGPCSGGNCTCAPTFEDPDRYDPKYAGFLRTFGETQIATYEAEGSWGWLYWTWKTESSPQWSYFDMWSKGILPKLESGKKYTACGPADAWTGLSETY